MKTRGLGLPYAEGSKLPLKLLELRILHGTEGGEKGDTRMKQVISNVVVGLSANVTLGAGVKALALGKEAMKPTVSAKASKRIVEQNVQMAQRKPWNGLTPIDDRSNEAEDAANANALAGEILRANVACCDVEGKADHDPLHMISKLIGFKSDSKVESMAIRYLIRYFQNVKYVTAADYRRVTFHLSVAQ